ncbi:MAG: tetratricopeptide repeat protein [Candidatus Hydrogenedentes bacterium]|nr:tetratricopeptide repeat protein [Candidatus Hydrogenedentota bacterium]
MERFPRRQLVTLALAIFVLMASLPHLSCSPGSAQRIEDARGALAEAEEQLELARETFGTARQDETNEHLRNAQDGFVKARDLYLEAWTDLSSDAELLEEFAACAVRTEDYDLAAKAYRRAATYRPENNEYWLEAGRNFVRVGKGMADEAREALEVCQARALDAGDTGLAAQTSTLLGHLYRKLALYELAREYYESARTSDPDHLGARLGLIGLDFREGRVLEAQMAVDQAGQLAPSDASFLEMMLQFGYAGFHESHAWFVDRADDHMAYAKLLTRLSRLSEAILAVQRVVDLDARNVVALNLLGSLARESGDTARARDAFNRSLAVDPDQPRTREAIEGLASSPQ